MTAKRIKKIAVSLLLLGLKVGAWPAMAQNSEEQSPFAPIGQYLMERNGEIALARTGAPAGLSNDADVLVLGQNGYETAVKGKNGFVCIVQRGWTSAYDDPEFGSPKLLYPICYNAAAARSYLPIIFKKTTLALTTPSKADFAKSVKAAFDKKELPVPEPGSMCYMMSKQAYFGKAYGNGSPHLMFFALPTDSAVWGAGLPGSPIELYDDAPDRLVVFTIPVRKWSDGTSAPTHGN
jgi:hypothetical protein